MTQPTEYAMLKRVLSYSCAVSPDYTQTDANMLIGESVDSAFRKLPAEDRKNIVRNTTILRAKCPKLARWRCLRLWAIC